MVDRHRLVAVLASLFLLPTLSSFAADDPSGESCSSQIHPAVCAPAAGPGREIFEIDARTGEAAGDTRHRLSDAVDIRVIHKNPFLYEHQLKIDEKVVAETDLDAALGRLFGGFAEEKEAAKKAGDNAEEAPSGGDMEKETGKPPTTSTNSLAADECHDRIDHINVLLDEYRQGEKGLTKARMQAATATDTLNQRVATFKKETEGALGKLTDSGASCEVLAEGARSYALAVDEFSEAPELGSWKKAVVELKGAIARQSSLLGIIRERIDELPPQCRSQVGDLSALASKALEAAGAERAAYDKLEKTIDSSLETAKGNCTRIGRIVGRPNAFYSVRSLGPYDLPTDAFVTLKARPVGDAKLEFSEVGSWKLNFGGGPRFALTGGLLYSSLGQRSFETIDGFVHDRSGAIVVGDGKEKFGEIVGVEEESDRRLGPILVLHTRVASPKGVGGKTCSTICTRAACTSRSGSRPASPATR